MSLQEVTVYIGLMIRCIYSRLVQILTGKDSSGDFDKLSPESCSAILQILTETKPDFLSFNKAPLN